MTTTNPSLADTEPAPSPGLLAVTVAALQHAGRLVSTDWEMNTFDVLPVGRSSRPAGSPAEASEGSAIDAVADPDATLGVVLTGAGSVVFYAVWPETIPPAARPGVAEFALHLNTSLTTSAVEFDTGTGILSVRSGLRLGGVALGGPDADDDRPGQLGRAAWGGLLVAALDEVEEVARTCRPLVDRILGEIAE